MPVVLRWLAEPDGGSTEQDARRVCAEGHAYPVVNGAPILLVPDEAAQFESEIASAGEQGREYDEGIKKLLIRWVKAIIGSTFHLAWSKQVAGTIRTLTSDERWLDLGGGVRKRHEYGTRANLDIAPWAGVDVVGSGLRLPFEDGSFSAIWNEAVLEHVRAPQLVMKEMYRVLRPGGWAYVEVPFLQHFHAWPNDYQRWTSEGLEVFVRSCDDWQIEDQGVCVGPCSAVTALLADWVELFFWWGERRNLISDLARLLVLVPLFPLKFVDLLIAKHPARR